MFKASDEAKEIRKLFMKGFENKKQNPKLLYGLGVNTKALLEQKEEYNIVGLMDGKKEGQTFEGMHIYSEKEAKSVADIIIIVARAAILPLIYNRIKHLEKKGIKIYDVRGCDLSKNSIQDIEIPDYIAEETIKEEIIKHDLICFNIFNTLISRKVINPSDIFEIVELRLRVKGIEIPFAKLRKEAERNVRKRVLSPTLGQIYNEMCNLYNMEEIQEKIMEEEIQTEIDYSEPRGKIVEFLHFAKINNKKVYLVSEIYMETFQIERILKKCEITEYDEIILSCECKKNKQNTGELYKEIIKKELLTCRILYIGDKADEEYKGLDFIKIFNNYELLVHSNFRNILNYNNRKLGDSIAIGIFMTKYFNNPFLFFDNKGKLYLEKVEDVGYISYGPLVIGFLAWLKRTCEYRNINTICFMARDGWILEKVWKNLVGYFDKDNKFPKGKYILGSRRALAVSALKNEKDIISALEKVPLNMSNRDMLKSRYGLEDVEAKENTQKEDLVYELKDKILLNAKKEREHYVNYINKEIGEEKVALIDAVSSGTIAKYFFYVTEKKGAMMCLLASNVPNYSVYDEIETESYFGKDSKYIPSWNIHKYVGNLESVLTAPYPMFIAFDANNRERYAELEESQKNVQLLETVHNGIIEYAKDISKLIPVFEQMELTAGLCDEFFGYICEGECIMDKVSNNLGIQNNF